MVSNLVMNSVDFPKKRYLEPSSIMMKCVWSPFRGTLSPCFTSTLELYLRIRQRPALDPNSKNYDLKVGLQ